MMMQQSSRALMGPGFYRLIRIQLMAWSRDRGVSIGSKRRADVSIWWSRCVSLVACHFRHERAPFWSDS